MHLPLHTYTTVHSGVKFSLSCVHARRKPQKGNYHRLDVTLQKNCHKVEIRFHEGKTRETPIYIRTRGVAKHLPCLATIISNIHSTIPFPQISNSAEIEVVSFRNLESQRRRSVQLPLCCKPPSSPTTEEQPGSGCLHAGLQPPGSAGCPHARAQPEREHLPWASLLERMSAIECVPIFTSNGQHDVPALPAVIT